jgi:hypothetical protein
LLAGAFEVEKSRQADARRIAASRRTEQASFYVPINVYIHSLLFSLYAFIGEHGEHAGEQQWTSSDKVVSEAAHDWVWASADGLIRLGPDRKLIELGPRPCALPYELPAELSARIRAEPDGPLAKAYRDWVRTEWEPAVRRIADLIRARAQLMEPIPAKRLAEIFDEPPIGFKDWDYTPRGLFLSMWIAYARGWEGTLEKWAAGDYSSHRPNAPFPIGLLFFAIEGQTAIGGDLQGMAGVSQMGDKKINRFANGKERAY